MSLNSLVKEQAKLAFHLMGDLKRKAVIRPKHEEHYDAGLGEVVAPESQDFEVELIADNMDLQFNDEGVPISYVSLLILKEDLKGVKLDQHDKIELEDNKLYTIKTVVDDGYTVTAIVV